MPFHLMVSFLLCYICAKSRYLPDTMSQCQSLYTDSILWKLVRYYLPRAPP